MIETIIGVFALAMLLCLFLYLFFKALEFLD